MGRYLSPRCTSQLLITSLHIAVLEQTFLWHGSVRWVRLGEGAYEWSSRTPPQISSCVTLIKCCPLALKVAVHKYLSTCRSYTDIDPPKITLHRRQIRRAVFGAVRLRSLRTGSKSILRTGVEPVTLGCTCGIHYSPTLFQLSYRRLFWLRKRSSRAWGTASGQSGSDGSSVGCGERHVRRTESGHCA